MSGRRITHRGIEATTASLSAAYAGAPVVVMVVETEFPATAGRGVTFETAASSAAVEIRMVPALALHLIRDAILGLEAETLAGIRQGKLLAILRAAEANLASYTPGRKVRHDA